tara:strand:- start:2961 stop:4661 length:1701 start_codon:yes stop_codon:yes gene_type:complete
MSVFKIHINNRYADWTVYQDETFEEIDEHDINPATDHLFSDDVFTKEDGLVTIIHSTVRTAQNIPAVLILEKNKTYGRHGKKMLYRCVPDDIRLPYFIVPYEMKQIGFNKKFENKYVTMTVNSWEDKHPIGMLTNAIGDVSKLEHYYTYQLYCKSLHSSIQDFTRNTAKVLREKTEDEYIESILKRYPGIENQIGMDNVFTIDPETCTDYDDAMSIKQIDINTHIIKIYISNVSIWMDTLQLWEDFSERISTIYLPDRRRPMLPTTLSDSLCSLQENAIRFTFMSEYRIESGEIVDVSYKNVAIRVNKNYAYESHNLLANKDYHKIMDVVEGLNKKYNYVGNIVDSHDVVAYLMILMNYNTSKELLKYKNGIYRSVALKNTEPVHVPSDIPQEAEKFLKMWNSAAGQYVTYSDDIRHELLDLDNYVHITSPIRRLVDLLNMIIFQNNNKMITLSIHADIFLKKWMDKLPYINTTMRAIRKVQCDCSLLHTCITDPTIMENEYTGYIFDKLTRNDGLFQYIVYLPDIKMTSRITIRDDHGPYKTCKFKLFIFNDENKFKRKIRLNII